MCDLLHRVANCPLFEIFMMRPIAYSLYIFLFIGIIQRQVGCKQQAVLSPSIPAVSVVSDSVSPKKAVVKRDTSFFARLVPIRPVPRLPLLSLVPSGLLCVGAERIDDFISLLAGKKVGCVVNQTSMLGQTHLVDTLLRRNIKVVEIFSPEHGFRGTAEAGDEVASGIDGRTGIPIVSLYGKKHRPTAEEMQRADVIVFDIQDVGARFYTYLTTLFYVLEACAEYNKPLVLLDRPNPNGHYVDGPTLKPAEKSFVGALPIPVVHGCTLGEMAAMINGEGWLQGGRVCPLTVIPCLNYTHKTPYTLPIKPSPNLPNNKAIYLYPSLCLFEGTCVSVGRGTDYPFQCFGHPDYPTSSYTFMPTANDRNKNPLLNGRTCNGAFLGDISEEELHANYNKFDLSYLIDFYKKFPDKAAFFRADGFFNNLTGDVVVKKEIIAGKTMEEIRATWQDDLNAYKLKRKKYLLYPDFE